MLSCLWAHLTLIDSCPLEADTWTAHIYPFPFRSWIRLTGGISILSRVCMSWCFHRGVKAVNQHRNLTLTDSCRLLTDWWIIRIQSHSLRVSQAFMLDVFYLSWSCMSVFVGLVVSSLWKTHSTYINSDTPLFSLISLVWAIVLQSCVLVYPCMPAWKYVCVFLWEVIYMYL